MRATITRKMVETKIHGCVAVSANGEPRLEPLEPITVYGVVNERTATRELKNVYGKEKVIMVSKIESEEVQYEISVDDFIKHATRIGKVENVTIANNEN